MGDRRHHRRLGLRVREPLGRRRDRPQRDGELARLIESGDFSPATMERMAEVLGQNGPLWPPGNERDS
jgi:hypothetical protein